ncbi:MAG TPA: FAD-dependent oxidoreductase [Gemmatimonadales bacterium]|jgi:NADPH-dependent 2,4-dienoyl-CoA reductase/sulfur reductase-like enzyme/nitrite reductase/ring-hydroxylating ferredoxin subunit
MSGADAALTGPDLQAGVSIADVPDGGVLAGHAAGKPVLLARHGAEWFAIGAVCSHYSGPLPEGLVVGETVRCPWHHACFSLRTGQALRPPALNEVDCWRVELREGKVFVTGQPQSAPRGKRSRAATGQHPDSVIVVGAGAAGECAAETLRREGYQGRLTLYDPDPDAPYDRPNCSKDYLAGNASEDWIPLHPREFYRERGIDIVHNRRVVALEPSARRVRLDDGSTQDFGALLLATGATPVRLPAEMERGSLPVHYLRSLADSRAIIDAAAKSKRTVIIGASFIGLEVAASLRVRKLEVHVVSPDARPLERVMGAELGDFIQRLHEEHGVVFHLGKKATQIADGVVSLENGERLAAGFVVAGIGVRPNVELAERAGLTIDRGVVVDEHLQTSAPGIFAAGDIARWPDPHSGERIRVEHWVVAQRQGQAAARSILGEVEPFSAVPFFWSQHYDVPINYVGHAERWDRVEVDGDIAGRNCAVRFTRNSRTLAVATIYRDRESLEAEVEMEHATV